jgi:hypothetical protein
MFACKRVKLLEGRTKHRRLVNPALSNVSTTLDPMKPFEPVINIGSS